MLRYKTLYKYPEYYYNQPEINSKDDIVWIVCKIWYLLYNNPF